MIINIWQCPDPQYKIAKYLREYIKLTNLYARNIEVNNLIIEGHPFFTLGANDKIDTLFPKVGVEWESDETIEDFNLNHSIIYFDERLKQRVAKILYDESIDYEYLDATKLNEFLDSEVKWVDTYKKHIENNIIISGWAVGNAAQKTHLFLYQAIESCLPYVFFDICKNNGLTYINTEQTALNIYNNQFSENAYGFEIKIKLRQIRETLMLLNNRKEPTRVDVYYNKGNSKINLNI